ncbi:MAG: hypothetical protein QXE03_04140, partial [Candidatus Nitrosocaldus sp.]
MADSTGLRTTGLVTGLALLLLLLFQPYNGSNQPIVGNTVQHDNDENGANNHGGSDDDLTGDILTFGDTSDDTGSNNGNGDDIEEDKDTDNGSSTDSDSGTGSDVGSDDTGSDDTGS